VDAFKKAELIELIETFDEEDVKRKVWELEIERPYGEYRAACKMLVENDEDT
jgi:hypothetical protein